MADGSAGMQMALHPAQARAFQSEATEILYGGAAGGGKALALDTPIPTPSGWTTMGELRPGDEVLDEEGRPCRVVAATEVMHDRPCYRLTFSDGAQIVADAGHQWVTMTDSERACALRRTPDWKARRRANRPSRGSGKRPDLTRMNAERAAAMDVLPLPKGTVRTTEEIAATLMVRGRTNHSVRVAGALQLPEAALPIDPYTLGAWLGDGTSSQGAITTADAEVVDGIAAAGYTVTKRTARYAWGVLGLVVQLRASGVLGNKHIPAEYLRASFGQRMALLRGLMDTDGHCKSSGSCEFTTTSPRLRDGIMELLATLGIKAACTVGRALIDGKDCGEKYRIKFTTTQQVFTIHRKVERQSESVRTTQHVRMIVSAERIPSVPVRCIQVDSPSSLFLAGRAMIPTHNSHLMRVAAIAWCWQVPGLQVYLFRREFPDLYKNHMEGPTGFPALLAPYIGAVQINYGKNFIAFPNGAKIHLCHCQHDKNMFDYQGAEIHVLLIDELTHFSAKVYRYLRGRVRLGGLKIPPGVSGVFPRIICSSNPGGVGHNWVKSAWVSLLRPMEARRMDKAEGGMVRQYIPARLSDNPTMGENDPDYADRLAGLGDGALVKAMLEGDWNIVAGGALDDAWSPRVVRPRFRIPSSWRVDRSFDWGSSKPFSVGWWAESDGTEAVMPDGSRWAPPPRSLVLLHEWYGASGPNEGLKLPAREVARGILRIEKELVDGQWIAGPPQPGPADNSISSVSNPGTPTIADEMAGVGVRWRESDKAPGSRKIGLELIRSRLIEAGKDVPEEPALYVMDHCRNAIEHLPALPRDKTKPDDVDTDAEDHDYDMARYRVLAVSRKATVTSLRI